MPIKLFDNIITQEEWEIDMIEAMGFMCESVTEILATPTQKKKIGFFKSIINRILKK